MLSGGFPLGSLFGIRLRIHWLCLFWFQWFGLEPAGLLLLATFVITVIIHELGHCFAARSVGGQAHEILILPLGGLAFTTGGENSTGKWIWIALAGPLTHIPLALICYAILYAAGEPITLSDLNPFAPLSSPLSSFGYAYVYIVFKIQLLLLAFNLFLPAYPLDGGQILIGIMARYLPLRQTAAVAAGLAAMTAVVMLKMEAPILALFVGFGAFELAGALMSGTIGLHPIAQLYQPAQKAQPSSALAPPADDLRECPACGKKIHPRAEFCVHCDTRF